MNYCIVKDGVISNIIVCENDEIASMFGALPFYEGAVIGSKYEVPGPTPAELREEAYRTEKIIEWSGSLLTVDEANTLFLNYFAEGSSKADELSTLISEAKASIRAKYPD